MQPTKFIAAALLALLAAGCSGYRLPAGYVKVDPPWDARFKAVSAEGSALIYRTEENPENGNLAFWEKAVTNRLVDVGGYQRTDRQEIRNKSGVPGVELTFEHAQVGVDYLYVLALYVRGGRVHVLEAAGPKDKFTPDLPDIRKAIIDWPL
jgi:hypothetical protein